jgi:hypothetical protein
MITGIAAAIPVSMCIHHSFTIGVDLTYTKINNKVIIIQLRTAKKNISIIL